MTAWAHADYAVIVENKQIQRLAQKHQDQWLLPFPEIAQALDSQYRLDLEQFQLDYFRAQDHVHFRVDLRTGATYANRQWLGYLPDISSANIQRVLFPINMVQVLTGTHAHIDKANRRIQLTLDERLKTIRGFKLYVNGRRIPTVSNEPVVQGSILLLPLRPIVQALGQSLAYDAEKKTVTVLRVQDSTRISLNLQTGLVKINERPTGISPNMGFADAKTLLLPATAIETLTGTHVNVLTGTSEIHVDLDTRLQGRLLPTQTVLEAAKQHPFTLEEIDFLVGSNTVSHLTTRQSWRYFNSRFRYEVSNLPAISETWKIGSLEPDWIALEYQSIFGSGGSIGDYVASYGELAGIGVSRLRGLSFYRPHSSGQWVFLAGSPLVGSKIIGDEDTAPQYSGFAASTRYYHHTQNWEAGLGYLETTDLQRWVASQSWNWQKKISTTSEISFYENLDVGYFSDPLGDESDWRTNLSMHYRPLPRLSINGDLNYEGAHFKLGPTLNAPNIALSNLDELSTGLGINWRILDAMSIGWKGQIRRLGESWDWQAESTNQTFALSTQPWHNGPWFSLEYQTNHYRFSAAQIDTSSTRWNAYVRQRFEWLHLTLRYEHYQLQDTPANNELSLTADFLPVYFSLPQSANISIGGSLYAARNDDRHSLRGSIHVHLDSGRWLGEKTHMTLDLGHLEPIYSEFTTMDDPFAPSAEKESPSDYINLNLDYRINENLQLELNYHSNFQGEDALSLALRGHFGINPPRRYRLPLPGRGVLKGRVFLDLNNDGIQQEDEGEVGLGGIDVGLAGTPFWLKTNADGYFTIHNLKQGSYQVAIDRQRLPLQILVRGGKMPLTTIGEGQITEIEIPLITAGQILGHVFVDSNANGQWDPDEATLEGITLRLQPGDRKTYSTTFGQFAFDQLPPGTYHLEILTDWLKEQYQIPTTLEITLESPDALLQRKNIPLRPKTAHSPPSSIRPKVRATP